MPGFYLKSSILGLLGIIPSPGKGSQWWNATGKTWGMPPVGIWSTGKPIVSSEDDKQDNSDIYVMRVGDRSHVDIQAGELTNVLQACIYMITNVIQL